MWRRVRTRRRILLEKPENPSFGASFWRGVKNKTAPADGASVPHLRAVMVGGLCVDAAIVAAADRAVVAVFRALDGVVADGAVERQAETLGIGLVGVGAVAAFEERHELVGGAAAAGYSQHGARGAEGSSGCHRSLLSHLGQQRYFVRQQLPE